MQSFRDWLGINSLHMSAPTRRILLFLAFLRPSCLQNSLNKWLGLQLSLSSKMIYWQQRSVKYARALDCIAIESCQNYGALTHLECSRQSRTGIRHVLSQTKTTSAAQTHSIELPCAISLSQASAMSLFRSQEAPQHFAKEGLFRSKYEEYTYST